MSALRLALAVALGLAVAAAFLAAAYPPPPGLWWRLDFNGAPFEDFMGPYFETARGLGGAGVPAPGYLYPAFFAIALAPLAALGPAVAPYLWLVVEVAATVALVALPLALVPARRASEVGAFVALAALSHPLLHNLYWGQVSAPLTAAMFAAVWLGARGRSSLAGALIGVAAATKLVPALFVLGPLARGERRAVVVAGGVAAALLVLPAVSVLGFDGAREFHTIVAERLQTLGGLATTLAGGRGSQDLGAALARWCGDERAFLVGRGLGLGLAVALVARLRRERDTGVVFTCLALLGPLLVAPTWSHGLVFVPASAWCLWHAPGATALHRAAAASAMLLTSMPLHALTASPEEHARLGLGAAAVVVLAVGALVRRAAPAQL